MNGKTSKIITFFILIILLNNLSYALSDEEKQLLISDAQKQKEKIISECIEDPYNCPCEEIPCEDIKTSEDPDSKKAYNKCLQEVDYCKTQRTKGIAEMELQKQEIEAQCRKDFSKCDCSIIKSESGREECETAMIKAKAEAEKERAEQMKIIERECRLDFSKCDCSGIDNEQGQKECENALIEAKYQAEKERTDMIRKCHEDITKCACETIENENGRRECEAEKEKAIILKEKIKQNCEENIALCDCTIIESQQGRQECENSKKEAYKKIESSIRAALSKCFKDVENCDCSKLSKYEEESNAGKNSYVNFCEVQKEYGLNCKHKGINCEKLEDVELYPPGMPPWLGTIFARNYKDFIEKEKDKGLKEASSIIINCINNPEKCECEKVPEYSRPFCERMKQLQVRCYSDDYNACMMLDESQNLPEGMPYFMQGTLNKMIQSLRDARERIVKGRASKQVGDMILECMDDTSKCDCSIAPTGKIKSFCEYKIDLVKKCKDNKHFESCFILHEEPITDDTIPDFVKSYLEKNVAPLIEEKKNDLFNIMKQNTICEEATTIPQCKILYEKQASQIS